VTGFRNITPFAHDFHFFIIGHEFSLEILNLSVLKTYLHIK